MLWKAPRRRVFAGAIVCATALAHAANPYRIDVFAISSGSAVNAANPCSRLSATIGEPAPGFSSGGGFDLSAGFQSIIAADVRDTLFFGGFEECLP
jgi:hypothetical protein